MRRPLDQTQNDKTRKSTTAVQAKHPRLDYRFRGQAYTF